MRRVLFAAAILLTLAILFGPHIGHVFAAFDGAPTAPQPFTQHPEYANWDVQVHSRDRNTWGALTPMQAHHGSDCAGPPASHANTSYEGAVFVCNNHLMTSMHSGDGYGLIVLTPNRQLDLSGGGSVSFDLSTERMSTRDWWDVMISPWDASLALPLHSDLSGDVDLQGTPLNFVQINSDQGGPVLTIGRNGVVQTYQIGANVPPISSGVAAGTNQAATRQSLRFTVGNGRMRFERLASPTAPALVFWDVAADPPFASGVVQFGHHSYNPSKDGAGNPASWHWDNMVVSNADLNSPLNTPFTILHTSPRHLESAGSFTFPAAPANAYLRFSAICRPVINGVALTPQQSTNAHKPEVHSSYRVAIPAGSTSASVAFTNDDWYTPGYGCNAKDAHVWSLAGQSQPTATPVSPTNTPAPTATVTSTVVAPTQTPTVTSTPVPANTATSTATLTAVPTNTPAPTSTVVPTSTADTIKCAMIRVQGNVELGRTALVDCP